MEVVANIALVLAVAALIPSAGPFTPAIFVSAFTALIGVAAIAAGNVRRGILTVYFALSAGIVSPVLFAVQRVEFWLLTLLAIGFLSGLVFYLNHNRRKSSLNCTTK